MKTFKFVVIGLVILAIAGFVYYLVGDFSDGFRAGTVIKISKKGFILKTYEGQLNLGMILNDADNGSSGHDGGGANAHVAVSNIWRFSVASSDTAVIRQLDEAVMSGKRVKLHYREKFAKVPWRGDTKYQVYQVETAQ